MGSVHDPDCGKRIDWMHRNPLCDDCLTEEEAKMWVLPNQNELYYKEYTLNELEEMLTLASSQADNLKIDTGTIRVWLSRCTIADGEPHNNKVSVEYLEGGGWKTIRTYEAMPTKGGE